MLKDNITKDSNVIYIHHMYKLKARIAPKVGSLWLYSEIIFEITIILSKYLTWSYEGAPKIWDTFIVGHPNWR